MVKIPVMSIDFIKTILIFTLIILPSTPAASEVPAANGSRKIVVLDPGHGGHETGAIGSEGIFEKKHSHGILSYRYPKAEKSIPGPPN